MTSSANNRGFSRMGVDPTVSGLVDGTDFPHSALFHALNIATQGNYAVIEGNDFDITQSDSGGKTQFAVAAGKVIRNGVLQAAVSTANFTQGTPSSFEEPTSGFAYYLLVVNSSNALALKDNGGTILNDIVPNPATTDIPIAVIRLGAGETTTQRHVQFLTTTKTSNSLSIARDNSGVYTESATVKSNAGDIEFESLETDKDIIFKVKDGSSVVDRLILYGDNDPSFPNTEVKIEGSLLATEDIQANKIALGYGNSPTSGAAEISAYSSSEPMVFKTGSAVERLRITTDGKVGIGTGNPTGILHVKGTSASDIDFLVEVAEDGGSASPDVVYFRNSASPAAGDDLAHLRFRGRDSVGNTADYVDIFAEIVDPTNGSEDGRITFRTLKNGAITSRIELDSDETVINDAGADINFRVEGDTNANLIFADAGNDRVGIGTNVPLHTLHAIDRTNDFPYRFEVSEGNLRINKFGHLQIQNENSGDANATSFDDPFWQIGQRDTGELDITFGTPGTGNAFVGANDDIISMKRDSNSATGAKQIGFLGATAVSRPAAPAAVPSIVSTSGAAPADPEQNADAINALITALTNLGLIG